MDTKEKNKIKHNSDNNKNIGVSNNSRDLIEEKRIKRDIQKKKARSNTQRRKRAIRLAIFCAIFTIVVLLGSAYIILHMISSKESLREAGIAAYKEGNYQEATKNFIASLGEEQWFTEEMDEDTRLYLAAAYMYTGEYLKAADQYNTLLINESEILDKDTIEGYQGLAIALDTAGNGQMDDKTINTLNEEIENGNPSVAIILGGYYQSLGDYDKMLSYYQTYIDTYGINTYIAYQLSSYYLTLQDYDKAASYINQGLAASDDLYIDKIQFNEIVILEKNLDYQGAFDKISALFEKYPDNEIYKREYDYLNSRINFDTQPVNGDEETE
ncbi:MAG: hypothetical protein K6E10_07360 [Eubacterium sp.]|nr:hypothetical protein [Eubacterium sp.]